MCGSIVVFFRLHMNSLGKNFIFVSSVNVFFIAISLSLVLVGKFYHPVDFSGYDFVCSAIIFLMNEIKNYYSSFLFFCFCFLILLNAFM